MTEVKKGRPSLRKFASKSLSFFRKSATPANISATAKAIMDIGETLKDVPYVNAIAGIVVTILEIREEITQNKEMCYRLIDSVAKRSRLLVKAQEQFKIHGTSGLETLEKDILRYGDILTAIQPALVEFTPRASRVLNREKARQNLEEYSRWLDELDYEFNFSRSISKEILLGRILAILETGSIIPPVNVADTSKTSFLPAPPQQNGNSYLSGNPLSLPPPSSMFTGRDNILSKLHQYFITSDYKGQRVSVLYGLGGAGKTQIALKFVEKAGDHFSNVYFIDASSTETLEEDLKRIGPIQDLRLSLQWLTQQQENWLLLYDNADDPSINLRPFFPQRAHGNILITTRNRAIRIHAPDSYHEIENMDPEDAVRLLLRYSMLEKSQHSHAIELASELGYFALALAQAGAFIAESRGISFDDYLAMFKESRGNILGCGSVQQSDRYTNTVHTTWELSFKQLSPVAAMFLQLCAFWHNENISKTIFQRALCAKSDLDTILDDWSDAINFLSHFESPDGHWDEFAFQKIIRELSSFSLISSHQKGIYSIHSLVHGWAKDRSDADERRRVHALSGHLLALSINLDVRAEDYIFRKSISNHVTHWLLPNYNGLDASSGKRFARVFEDQGWWAKTEHLWEAVIAIQKDALGEKHSDALTSRAKYAYVLRKQGKWAEAELIQKDVLNCRTILLGERHPETFMSIANLASTYQDMGRFREAEVLGVQVLRLRQEVMGEQHPDTLRSMASLGYTYWMMDRLTEAEALQTQVVEVRKKLLGEKHPDTLRCMGNLAYTYGKMGRLKEAEDLEVTVVESAKEILGESHPDTLLAMAILVDTYFDEGKWNAAAELGEHVLEFRKAVLGNDHPYTLESMTHLGMAYTKLKRWSEAQDLLKTALEKQRILFGIDHPSARLTQKRMRELTDVLTGP